MSFEHESISLESLYASAKLLQVSESLDKEQIRHLVETEDAECWYQDQKDLEGPLHKVIHGCHKISQEADKLQIEEIGLDIIRYLLEHGAVWMQIDKRNQTAACLAKYYGFNTIYRCLVHAGVCSELLLRLLNKSYENAESVFEKAGSYEYRLSNESELLVDNQGIAVMMSWESEIMKKSALLLSRCSDGKRILNIGFGLGIIDSYIQEQKPSLHVIVEPHPDVLLKMRRDGWYEKPNVIIIEGCWQDKTSVIREIYLQGPFDGIYYDVYGEYFSNMQQFFELVIDILEPFEGIFSFFNGMGADKQIFYDVCCEMVTKILKEIGMHCSYEDMSIDRSTIDWADTSFKYWNLDKYKLPKCQIQT